MSNDTSPSGLLGLDHAGVQLLNGLQGNAWLDVLMLVVTLFGTAFIVVPLACFALFYARAELVVWRAAAVMSVVLVLCDLGLKHLVDRKRPSVAVPDVKVLGPMLTSLSFPSGHTVTAFALVGLLYFVNKRWALWFTPVAVAVGVSRVYLGVHFPSDVLAGALLGGLLSYGVTRAIALRMSR